VIATTRPRSKDVPRRSIVFDIIKNWKIKLRKLVDKQRYDIVRYDGILFIYFHYELRQINIYVQATLAAKYHIYLQ